MWKRLTGAFAATVMLLCLSSPVLALPSTFVQEGMLLDAQGRTLDGEHDIAIRILSIEGGGQVLYEELHQAVPIVNGYYGIQVGTIVPLDPSVFWRDRLHMTIKIDDGVWLEPYTELMAVPAAMVADVARDVRGNINPTSVTVAGQVVIDENGNWVGSPTGLRGPQGEPGIDGVRGLIGDKGDPGDPGPRGPAGLDGGQGVDGAQGQQGLQGSPDTPEQVLAKVVQVDGTGSALDADTFDGFESSDFVRRGNNDGDASEFDGPLWVRGDHVRIGTQGFQTGIQFLNTGTKNAAFRFDGNRTVYLEDASGPHPASDWYQPGTPTHLEVRNGSLIVNGRSLLRGSVAATSDVEVAGNVDVGGFVAASAGDGNNGIVFDNAGNGAGDLAYLKYVNDGGAQSTALEIAAMNDVDDKIRLKANGGVDIVGSGDLRATGDVEIARTVKVGGTSRLDGAVTARSTLDVTGKTVLGADTTIGGDTDINGDLSVGGTILPSAAGGIRFPNVQGADAQLKVKDCGANCTNLELRVGDQNGADRVTVYAAQGILLDGPGQGALGLHWPSNRWGGDANNPTDAMIQFLGQGAGNSQLKIEVVGDGDDDMLLRAPGGIVLDGDVRVTGSLLSGDAGGFGPVFASSGDGDEGIVFPNETVGGPGDDAWIRYLQDGGNGNSALQIGIGNDLNDEIELYGRSPVEMVGPGNANDMLGIKFKQDYFGGAGDQARVVYFQDGDAGDTRLQISNGGDQNDEINLRSNAPILIDGPSTGPIGLQFQENRWGGAGDQAYLRYRSERGEDTVLELGIEGDADDNLVLKGTGGIKLDAPVTEIGGNLTVGGALNLVGGISFDQLGINIGNEAPRATLDINGKTEIRGGNQLSLRSEADAVRGLLWAAEAGPHLNIATSTDEDIGFRDGTNGTVNLFIGGNGRVGVGTTTPADQLEVNGGGLLVNGGHPIRLRAPGGSDRGFFGVVDGHPTLNIATSGGESIAFRDNGLAGDVNMFIDGNGRVGVGTQALEHFTFTVEGSPGTDSHSAMFHTADRATYVGIGARDKSYYLTTTSAGSFAVHRPGVGDRLTIDDGGRMGVGIPTPGYKLHVGGDAYVAGPATVNGSLTIENGNVIQLKTEIGDLQGMIRASSGTPHLDIATSNDEDIAFRDNGPDGDINLFIRGDGRVGVGTVTPEARLDVNGDIKANTFIGNLRLADGGTFTLFTEIGNPRGMLRASEGTPHFDIATSGNEDIAFRDGGTGGDINMLIKGDGKVGIGTQTPGAQLHVNSTLDTEVRVQSPAGKTAGISFNTGAADAGRIYHPGSSEDMRFQTNGADRVVIHENGSMGIGTMAPEQKLDVKGGVQVDGNLYVKNKNQVLLYDQAGANRGMLRASVGGVSHLDIATSGNENIAFRDGGADGAINMFIRGDGHVGVGTTAPSSRLHVNGDIRANGDVIANNLIGNYKFPDGATFTLNSATGVGRAFLRGSDASPQFDIATANGQDIAFRDNGVDGTVNLMIKGDGKIGIGTSAPADKLHVNGQVRIEDDLLIRNQGRAIFYDENNSWRGQIRAYGNGPHLRTITSPGEDMSFADGDFDTTANLFLEGSNGYVGMGTNTPGAKLDLLSTGTSELRIRSPKDNWAGLFIDAGDGQPGRIYHAANSSDMRLYTNGSDRMIIKSDGKVGIGTTGPVDQLHVNGNVRADGHMLIRGEHQLLLYDGVNNTRGMIRGSADGLNIATAGGKYVAFRDNGITGTVNMFIRGDGNVGIGTTAPDQRLRVNGNVRVDGNIYVRNKHQVLLYDQAGSNRGMLRASVGGVAHLDIATSGGEHIAFRDGGADGQINMFIRGDGHVGIGTTAPATTLHVVSPLAATALVQSAPGNYAAIAMKSGDADAGWIYHDRDSPDMRFFTSGADRMVVAGNGNVGIGTNSPAQKLHVAGDIQTEGHVRIKNKQQLLLYTESNNLSGYIRASEGAPHLDIATSGNEAMAFRDGGPDGDINMYITGGGSVGIGTSSPLQKLHVNGSIQAERDLLLKNGGHVKLYTENNNLRGYIGASEGSPYLDIATSGGESIAFRDGGLGGDINMFISGTGNVGIGTTSPTDKLHVNGAATVNDLRFQNGNDFRIDYPGNMAGGTGDDAWIRYYKDGDGSNTRFQIGVVNDSTDDINLYSNAPIYLSGPGTNALGIDFQDNRWGGAGDDAYIKYERDGDGDNSRLVISVGNDRDDNMIIRASGGIILDGDVKVTGRFSSQFGGGGPRPPEPGAGSVAGQASCPPGYSTYGDLCFSSATQRSTSWSYGNYLCNTRGAHMCTSAEMEVVRYRYRGFLPRGFWTADSVLNDDATTCTRIETGGTGSYCDGYSDKQNSKPYYCCISR